MKEVVAGFDASEAVLLVRFLESASPLHREAASWIVKGLLEVDRPAGLDLERFFRGLSGETHWPVLLHILQSVQYAPTAARGARASAEALLEHKKTLVAVWALDAHVRLAVEAGDGLDAARPSVEDALSDKRASMRARARHLAPFLGL